MKWMSILAGVMGLASCAGALRAVQGPLAQDAYVEPWRDEGGDERAVAVPETCWESPAPGFLLAVVGRMP